MAKKMLVKETFEQGMDRCKFKCTGGKKYSLMPVAKGDVMLQVAAGIFVHATQKELSVGGKDEAGLELYKAKIDGMDFQSRVARSIVCKGDELLLTTEDGQVPVPPSVLSQLAALGMIEIVDEK